MANGYYVAFVTEAASNLLRRPTSIEIDPYIVHHKKGLEVWPPLALLPAKIIFGLGLFGQLAVRYVMIGVPFQFP